MSGRVGRCWRAEAEAEAAVSEKRATKRTGRRNGATDLNLAALLQSTPPLATIMMVSTPPTLASMLRTATRTLPSSPLATSSRRTLTSSAVVRADDPTSGVRAYVRQLAASNSASNSSSSSSSRAPAFRNASRQAASPSFAVNSPRAAPAHLGAMRSPSAVNGGAASAGRAAANATAKAQAIRMAFHGQVSTCAQSTK